MNRVKGVKVDDEKRKKKSKGKLTSLRNQVYKKKLVAVFQSFTS